MSSGYLLSGDAIAKLADDHRRLLQTPQNLRQAPARPFAADDFADLPFLFQNSGSVKIPPYSLLAVTGMMASASEPIVTIAQPTTPAAPLYLISDADPVLPGAIGAAQRGPLVKFAFDTGTPALNDNWGPKASQWTASVGTSPAILRACGTFSESNQTYGWGWLARPFARIIYGTLSGSLTAGGSVSCAATGCVDGSPAPSGSITVYDEIYGNLTGSSGNPFKAVENFSTGHWAFEGIVCS